jgi:hypothetical protein
MAVDNSFGGLIVSLIMPKYGMQSIKRLYDYIHKLVLAVLTNPLFQIPVAVVFIVPIIATLGQFIHSGFIETSTPVFLLFWPGTKYEFAPDIPVWLVMGVILISYVTGLIYLLRNKNLGKVVLLGVIASVIAIGLADILNSFTGWTELQNVSSIDLTGRANTAIFSLWQNPVWEEIVFRGIPLLVLTIIIKAVNNKSVSFWAKLAYLVIPSAIFAFYHIPNHGPARIVDTFIIGLAFSWLALKFTFFAPLILHCIIDTIMIPNIGSVNGFPKEEIPWILNNQGLLNTTSTVAIIASLVLAIILFIWYLRRKRAKGISIKAN